VRDRRSFVAYFEFAFFCAQGLAKVGEQNVYTLGCDKSVRRAIHDVNVHALKRDTKGRNEEPKRAVNKHHH
jgi:hypothetical protein